MDYNELRPAFITWLNEYYKYTEKPVDKIIKRSENLLQKRYGIDFSKIDETIVIGMSYSDIDFPYLQWIAGKTNAKWNLGYFSDDDKRKASTIAKDLNLNPFDILSNGVLIDQILD